MKRRTALLLACAMACTMITGCGKKEEAPQQATEQAAAEQIQMRMSLQTEPEICLQDCRQQRRKPARDQ